MGWGATQGWAHATDGGVVPAIALPLHRQKVSAQPALAGALSVVNGMPLVRRWPRGRCLAETVFAPSLKAGWQGHTVW